jgi:hypothetical protein
MTDTPELAEEDIDAVRTLVRAQPDIVTADAELMGLVRGACRRTGWWTWPAASARDWSVSCPRSKPPTRP